MKYFDELCEAMKWLGEKPDTFFLGQAVQYAGTAMYNTLKDVPMEKRMEVPTFEETQAGMSYGLALQGLVPVSIFPRLNFLLLGMNQIVNHIDKYPLISDYKAKVIIRSGIGSHSPIHPQAQHVGDFTDAIRSMCKTIHVIRLDKPEQILEEYKNAYNRETSTILVEVSDYYNEEYRLQHDGKSFD